MTDTTNTAPTYEEIEAAMKAGNFIEATRLNNLMLEIEMAKPIVKKSIDTTAADNATGWKAQLSSRIERRILDRQESFMHYV